MEKGQELRIHGFSEAARGGLEAYSHERTIAAVISAKRRADTGRRKNTSAVNTNDNPKVQEARIILNLGECPQANT
jgi:hypothetical protein